MTDPTDPTPDWRNFYGRRFGKTLRPTQKTYLSQDLETLRPPGIPPSENPDRLPLDLTALFGDARPVWLEIGFGGGEHMVHMAPPIPASG
jgi:tRNA (guanine-N7-)-methyltransferase